MKKLLNILACLVVLSLLSAPVYAQEAEKPELMLNLRYFNSNNTLQYLQAKTMIRADKKMQPAENIQVLLYMDEVAEGNLVAKVKTNSKGEAIAYIPASLKAAYDAAPTHTFIAVVPASKDQEELTSEAAATRSRITIDTLNEEGTRQVVAKVESFETDQWVPAADVELKIGVARQGGELRIGEEETYTTDSTGTVTGEFKLDKLPAKDKKNNIMLVARIDDHETFGSVSAERQVPWGVVTAPDVHFGGRSLWATRDKAPIWLLVMAFGIMGGVWGGIFYLVFLIVRIYKLGKDKGDPTPALPKAPVSPHLAELEV
ncbi:MAG TPA: hypothetical protein VFZ78_04375 [Flavisolibacter sp.]